jgi:hypothetical protein
VSKASPDDTPSRDGGTAAASGDAVIEALQAENAFLHADNSFRRSDIAAFSVLDRKARHSRQAFRLHRLDEMLQEQERRLAGADRKFYGTFGRSFPPNGGLARITSKRSFSCTSAKFSVSVLV